MDDIVGTWLLTAAIEESGEIDCDSETPHDVQLDAWLYGSGVHLLEAAVPVHGMTLTITADGVFRETKTQPLDVAWYDYDGVLDADVTPFDGTVRRDGAVWYLHADELEDGKKPTEPERLGRVRYDDGDTIICDQLAVVGRTLVRTMSVVTDELYLDRPVLIYRAADEIPIGSANET